MTHAEHKQLADDAGRTPLREMDEADAVEAVEEAAR